jgi:uncharacterized protein
MAKSARTTADINAGIDSNVMNQESTIHESTREVSVEEKLIALFSLQRIDSQIDKIRIVRGELPLEVQDLEDEIAGLETRVAKFAEEIEMLNANMNERRNAIRESESLMKKYEAQQMNVRNNREFDSLSKEIEFQGLEIQLSEKRIKEYGLELELKKSAIEEANLRLQDRRADLEQKKGELQDIVSETEKEEENLSTNSTELSTRIEDRLLTAYRRIRGSVRNGLAVVMVERDACGGCFNKIPPQRHLDIRMHKKIIVCEYCGRILIDQAIEDHVNAG